MLTRSKRAAAKEASSSSSSDEEGENIVVGKATEGVKRQKLDTFARTTTRTGKLYSRLNRGHYATLAMLKKVHHKLFSMEPTMYVIGEQQQQ
jgi:hypothetical protein